MLKTPYKIHISLYQCYLFVEFILVFTVLEQ